MKKIFNYIAALVILCMLSACVAAVFVGAAGMVVYDRRSVAMLESDARIFYLINKNLVSEPRYSGSHIEIVSFNQVVLLVGQTPTASLRLQAERTAQSTPNVRRVYNEITTGPTLTFTTRSNDTLITGQIRSQMLARKGLESGSIRVVTENSVVYLMGIATHEQADIATTVARQTRGVVKVVKVFQYI